MFQHQIRIRSSKDQSGAALVVGLVLLVALTLLALASMNTASLDLIMTGNEQTRARVFGAAEAGLETAYQTAAMFDSASQQSSSGTTTEGVPYNYVVEPVNCGYAYNLRSRSGGGTTMGGGQSYKAIYFTIESTATVARGTATNTLGVEYVIQDPGTFGEIGGCSGGSSSSSSSSGGLQP